MSDVIKTAWRPTAKEMKRGPVVRLQSERWASMEWSPHGLAYNIIFDDKGKAVILKAHWDAWVDPAVAARDGIRIVKPSKPTIKKPSIKKEKD